LDVLPEPTRSALAESRSHEPEFVGATEGAARVLAADLGLELRVIAPGDAITFDLRPQRMTVVVNDDEVIEAIAG
jgi:hypothetical protein